MLRHAEDTLGERLAIRVWLTDVITSGMHEGEDMAPGLRLLAALEGLDFGCVDPLLRLPAGQMAGGSEKPPAQSGVDAMALAAIDRLHDLQMSVTTATSLVAECLGMEAGTLTNLRKRIGVQRGKPENKRTRYRSLIEDYEGERAFMADQSREEITHGLTRVAALLGRK